MNIIKGIVDFFSPKKATVKEELVISVVEPREMAKVIPLIDKELEYKDLQKKHSEFFDNKSPQLQFQSKIGENISANIEDVNPSRSNSFFQNAPSVTPNNHRPDFKSDADFEKLEKYMGVEIHSEEEIEPGDIILFN